MEAIFRLLRAILLLLFNIYLRLQRTFRFGSESYHNVSGDPLQPSILTKRPRHLAICVGIGMLDEDKKELANETTTETSERHKCFERLSDIIAWSVTLGIESITLYDSEGIIKESFEKHFEQDLVRLAQQQQQQLNATNATLNNNNNTGKMRMEERYIKLRSCYVGSEDRVRTFSSHFPVFCISDDESASTATINNNNKEVIVNILSLENGKQEIVEYSKKEIERSTSSSTKEKTGSRPARTFTANEILEKLKIFQGQREPDLLFVFAPVCALFGFPPAHLRLTEIMHVENLANFDRAQYNALLLKYSNVEQRFGK